MILSEYIEKRIVTGYVAFSYGYYGPGDSFMKDEKLSVSGTKEEVLSFISRNGQLQRLYACGGECNDFSVESSGDETRIQFTDFR